MTNIPKHIFRTTYLPYSTPTHPSSQFIKHSSIPTGDDVLLDSAHHHCIGEVLLGWSHFPTDKAIIGSSPGGDHRHKNIKCTRRTLHLSTRRTLRTPSNAPHDGRSTRRSARPSARRSARRTTLPPTLHKCTRRRTLCARRTRTKHSRTTTLPLSRTTTLRRTKLSRSTTLPCRTLHTTLSAHN